MGPEQHVEAVAEEAAALGAALRAGPTEAPVPTCPAWTVRDLATHVGGFAGFWAHVLCEGVGVAKTPAPDPPSRGPVDGWFAEMAGTLVSMLREVPPDSEVWTWSVDDHSAAFVARRAAHELAVHRVDAQLARGRATPIQADLAADGIEEIFVMIGNWRASGQERRAGTGAGETLHLRATDGDRAWTIGLQPDGLEVGRGAGSGDLTVTGTTSDLEWLLYQRPVLGPLERQGDGRVLDAWHRAFTFG